MTYVVAVSAGLGLGGVCAPRARLVM